MEEEEGRGGSEGGPSSARRQHSYVLCTRRDATVGDAAGVRYPVLACVSKTSLAGARVRRLVFERGWTTESVCCKAGAPKPKAASRRNEVSPIRRLGSELDAQLAAWQRRQDNDTPKGFQDSDAGPPAEPAGRSCRRAVFTYPATADFNNATCMGLDTTVRVCAENDDAAQKAADVSGRDLLI